ncbi:hypothetical protein T4A_4535 [Trichinella pseudospiralis]|uniref:Uncharacterized protein n=1 Tax=Trichinella pseudospiralis TaxID=6337 RepID=A0A0V1JK32_TRIPS|nr:hypothetical protein T4A_4535 [Trichinella pseudospiralis]KRZ35334.1 hypothetical protein T4C_1146 [Trichinella pseudospiralis]
MDDFLRVCVVEFKEGEASLLFPVCFAVDMSHQCVVTIEEEENVVTVWYLLSNRVVFPLSQMLEACSSNSSFLKTRAANTTTTTATAAGDSADR